MENLTLEEIQQLIGELMMSNRALQKTINKKDELIKSLMNDLTKGKKEQ